MVNLTAEMPKGRAAVIQKQRERNELNLDKLTIKVNKSEYFSQCLIQNVPSVPYLEIQINIIFYLIKGNEL